MIHTAQALQLVRRAQIDFLLNWTRDQVARVETPHRLSDFLSTEDSDKHNWRHLYDGSVLDD